MKIQPLKMLKVEANITEIRQASATRYSLYFVFDVLLYLCLMICHKILRIVLPFHFARQRHKKVTKMISLLRLFCTVCDHPEKCTFSAIHQQCRKVKVLPQKAALRTKCLCHAKVKSVHFEKLFSTYFIAQFLTPIFINSDI